MLRQQPEAAAAAVTAAGEALLLALQRQALVREALASAAVALYAAAALPAAPPAAVARCFAEGLLLAQPQQHIPNGGTSSSVGGSGEQPPPVLLLLPGEPAAEAAEGQRAPIGLLDARLQQRQQHGGRKAGLSAELRRLPPLSRLCAIRGAWVAAREPLGGAAAAVHAVHAVPLMCKPAVAAACMFWCFGIARDVRKTPVAR